MTIVLSVYMRMCVCVFIQGNCILLKKERLNVGNHWCFQSLDTQVMLHL